MRAFTETPISHEAFVAALRALRDADRIVQGVYWGADGGCAVGCGIEAIRRITGEVIRHDDYGAFANATGIPEALAQMMDCVHDGLSPDAAREWPLKFAEAVRPGVELADVARRVLIRVLREVAAAAAPWAEAVCERVAAGFDSRWAGDTPFEAAASAAAVAEAAPTHAAAAAARAAQDAALAASWAEADPAWAAEAAWAVEKAAEAAAWAEAGAGAEAYGRIADILIDECLGESLPPA
jgi:hypothetical protein